jgi:hypothetical protein
MLFRAARLLALKAKNVFAANQDVSADFHCPKTLRLHELRDSLPRNATKASRFRLRNPVFGLEFG